MSRHLPAVKDRGAWNAARAKVQRTAPQSYTHLEVHHTASPSMASARNTPSAVVLRNIQRNHMKANGWNDIFYNGFVMADGTVWEGRPDTPGPYRLCFLGNFEHEQPTPGQRETLRVWMNAFDTPVDWHAKRAAGTKYASACPGKLMIALIWELIAEADIPQTQEDQIMSKHTEAAVAAMALNEVYEVHADRPIESAEAFGWQLNRYLNSPEPDVHLRLLALELETEAAG